MLTIDKLRDYGANVDEGLARCMNNEAFYLRLVGMALGDASFEKLEQAVEQDDLEKAFEAAHALKGVLSNLSLTPICGPVSEMTELLRARKQADYPAFVAAILSERDRLTELSR